MPACATFQICWTIWKTGSESPAYPMTFKQQITDIVADRESGSSQLVARIQDAFHGIENNAPDIEQLRWAFRQLRQIDRSMAVVHHLLNTLEPALGPTFFRSLNDYQQHWADLPRRVAAQLIQARNWRDSNILVHSRSGMLQETVTRINAHYGGLIIWQTRSEPGGEGVAQHQDLQRLNVAAHLVEDDQVAQLAASMDAAWLGVDQYNDDRFVNKVGSKQITNAMGRAGKTTFVLGDPRKRVDALNFSTTLFETVPFSRDTCLINGDTDPPA